MEEKKPAARFRQKLADQGEGLARFLYLLVDDPLDAEDLFYAAAHAWARDPRARALPFAPFETALQLVRELKRRGKKLPYRPVDLEAAAGKGGKRLLPLRRTWEKVPIDKRAVVLLLAGEGIGEDQASVLLGIRTKRLLREAERGLLLFEREWTGGKRIPVARAAGPGEYLRRRLAHPGGGAHPAGMEAPYDDRYDAGLASALLRFTKLYQGTLRPTEWKRILRRVVRELPESEYVLLTDTLRTPFGPFHLGMLGGALVCTAFGGRSEEEWVPAQVAAAAPECRRDPKALREAGRELEEYFSGRRKRFTVAHRFVGASSFQASVLDACARVPFGRVGSYKRIAEQVGRPQATRAVGRALGRNPLPVVIPCHRIISHTGTLVGYSAGLAIKERLLALEGLGGLFTSVGMEEAAE